MCADDKHFSFTSVPRQPRDIKTPGGAPIVPRSRTGRWLQCGKQVFLGVLNPQRSVVILRHSQERFDPMVRY